MTQPKLVKIIRQTTREEAEREDRLYEWSLTPRERLRNLEWLRRMTYPNGIPPRLQSVSELLKPPRG